MTSQETGDVLKNFEVKTFAATQVLKVDMKHGIFESNATIFKVKILPFVKPRLWELTRILDFDENFGFLQKGIWQKLKNLFFI